MQTQKPGPQNKWDERDSEIFIDYGRYFVPDRERQVQTMVDLIPRLEQPHAILDLGCGEGLLAEAILEQQPESTVHGLDRSLEMIKWARERLKRFGERFQAGRFDLFIRSWPQTGLPISAVVSSLAIHHLDEGQKQGLFGEVYALLKPGGVFVIADLVEPASRAGWELAAKAWDDAVQQRALELDGNLDAFARFEAQGWNLYRHFDPQGIDKPSRLLEQLKWLEQAGFASVDAVWMLAGHAIFGGTK
jgi:tRNA (cmo5U34)-methyltransferase